MNRDVEYALPQGWTWATVEELTSYVQRGKSPIYAARSELPVVNQKCVRWHGVEAQHVKFIDRSQWNSWAPERSLRDGDILWNSTGTGTIGRAAIYRPIDGFDRVVADSHVTIVRVRLGPPEYLHAWIRSPIVQGRIDAMQTGSTNQVELGRTEVLRTRVPVAPINEQRRIVAKLESLQARSRRARAALDAVPPLLEKLRQSVLAAAFRGDLTKDWRAKNKDVEPASELLKRIRVERRKKWEEGELAKMRAKGKVPGDGRWKEKYKEPEPVDETGLPELPEGWCWASLESLTDADRGIPYGIVLTGDPDPTGVATVRCGDIKNFDVVLDGLKRVSSKVAEEFARTRLLGGEVLIAIRGTVGATAVATDAMVGMNISREVAMIPTLAGLMPRYLMFCLASPESQRRVMKHVKGVAQAGINLSDLRALPVPVAPIAEQSEVLIAVERQLRRCTKLRESQLRGADSVRSLERSVLARAFRGGLVPQDPNDEPANATLAQLHGEDAGASYEAPGPSRHRKRKTA